MNARDDRDQAPDPRVARRIDENLRLIYGGAAGQDMPDRFKDLIEQLKARQGEGESKV